MGTQNLVSSGKIGRLQAWSRQADSFARIPQVRSRDRDSLAGELPIVGGHGRTFKGRSPSGCMAGIPSNQGLLAESHPTTEYETL